MAVAGDKLIDWLDIEDKLSKDDNINGEYLDNYRQKNSSNKAWISIFDRNGFEKFIQYNKSNKLGQDIKSAFIEALIYVVFKINDGDYKVAFDLLQKIREHKEKITIFFIIFINLAVQSNINYFFSQRSTFTLVPIISVTYTSFLS